MKLARISCRMRLTAIVLVEAAANEAYAERGRLRSVNERFGRPQDDGHGAWRQSDCCRHSDEECRYNEPHFSSKCVFWSAGPFLTKQFSWAQEYFAVRNPRSVFLLQQ